MEIGENEFKKKNDPLLVESKVSEEKKHLFISGIV